MLDYDGKKKAEHMCSAVSTLGELRTGGQYGQARLGETILTAWYRNHPASGQREEEEGNVERD